MFKPTFAAKDSEHEELFSHVRPHQDLNRNGLRSRCGTGRRCLMGPGPTTIVAGAKIVNSAEVFQGGLNCVDFGFARAKSRIVT